MTYNFDKIIERKGSNCVKWDLTEDADLLPMWIADMDFETAPVITAAMQKRMTHHIFGYTFTPPAFYEAIMCWWRKRHNFSIAKDEILAVSGVIPALASILRAFTTAGDKVIIQPPVYNHFFISIEQAGCTVVENNLIKAADGRYKIDFADLEEKAVQSGAKLLIISNPHNPAGRVWTAGELRKVGDICGKHGILVISDEIHSDLIMPGHKHVPFASLGEYYAQNSITCSSPTKTFNIAGLQVAYMFTKNKEFRERVNHILNVQENFALSPFAIEALIAAYTDGDDWLETLILYLQDNYELLKKRCKEHIPALELNPLEATYLAWLDFSRLGIEASELSDFLIRTERLKLNEGLIYGIAGAACLRINLACPRTLLEEGLKRLIPGVQKYLASKQNLGS